MKEYTTAEIFEELWKRIEFDANVSEELATESNKLQARIDKAIEFLKENACYDEEDFSRDLIYYDCRELLDILKGSDSNE